MSNNSEHDEVTKLSEQVRGALSALAELSQPARKKQLEAIAKIPDPARLADETVIALALSGEGANVTERLTNVFRSLGAKLKEELEARDDREKQREEILRERMRQILQELGEDPDESQPNELLEKVRAAKMPKDVEEIALRQARRLSGMSDSSPESGITRNYLEWLTELPWDKRTLDTVDVPTARAVLDADHQGLEKVKRRILEYLAVRRLKPNKKGPILCLVGPPGVGKTSLGKSVARALGREFIRLSLGGVRDEAEIRGHRRTYIGALPGRIIQSMRRAGTKNPVMMLDEIDKLRADFRGDPSAAMLEVLDPEQNDSFSDHYLEVPFDLSEVIFIATANDLSEVPGPLRDRMEVIALPGYPLGEKVHIAEGHLVPKQLREHGLTEGMVRITTEAIEVIAADYTREAGVRNLERELGTLLRGVAVKVASGEPFPSEIGPAQVAEYLGPARFESEVAEQTSEPGVATGLAWTPVGGEILFIEATRMPGHGKLVLTGQLGDVMRESATAALSYVRSNAARLGIPSEVFASSDIHIHVPAGGTPKDGPSAGNALVSAIVSLLTGRRVRPDVAMTGEITLRGAVLPVGGIASKVLAAHRAGVKRVILPERNAKDLVEVPAEVRAQLDIVFVKKIDETLAAALSEQVMPFYLVAPPAQVALQAA